MFCQPPSSKFPEVKATLATPAEARLVGEEGDAIPKVVVAYVNPALAKLEANAAVLPAHTDAGVDVGVNATASITPTVCVPETDPHPVTVADIV